MRVSTRSCSFPLPGMSGRYTPRFWNPHNRAKLISAIFARLVITHGFIRRQTTGDVRQLVGNDVDDLIVGERVKPLGAEHDSRSLKVIDVGPIERSAS